MLHYREAAFRALRRDEPRCEEISTFIMPVALYERRRFIADAYITTYGLFLSSQPPLTSFIAQMRLLAQATIDALRYVSA